MSNNIKLKKGLALPLVGEAAKKVALEVKPGVVALKPTDFKGLIPKLLVKEGDVVKAGTPLFADKMCPEIMFTSPVSGTVQSIVRGEKRKLLAVTVLSDGAQTSEDFSGNSVAKMSAKEIKDLLLKSGLWTALVQRPYGVVANPGVTPKAIFVSGFSSAPNAADTDFVLEGETANIQEGINALKKMTGVAIHLSVCKQDYSKTPLHRMDNVILHVFDGKHPAGNVGVQIHHINPIRKGETVWTISPVMLSAIGKLFTTGKLDLTRLVAVTGTGVKEPAYVKALPGTAIKDLESLFTGEGEVRYISGDVLSGKNVGLEGFLGFFDNQISTLAEGNYYEMFGWMKPFRFNLFSKSRAYLSFLCCGKKYALDTNTHGGVRPFMFNNIYSDVLPMHLFPVYLAKACLAKDIEKMEQFGIYEVLPEDLATCEFVCPSKIEWQSIIAAGIDLMLKEMA